MIFLAVVEVPPPGVLSPPVHQCEQDLHRLFFLTVFFCTCGCSVPKVIFIEDDIMSDIAPLFKFVPYFVVSSCSSVSNESELLSFDVKLSPASLWDMGVDSAAKDSKVT